MFESSVRPQVTPNRSLPINRESDGPAIWGGCVTRRIPAAHIALYLNRVQVKAGKGGYAVPRRAKRDGGALFAVMVQVLLRAGAIAVQV